MNSNVGIYCIKNKINDKRYIGQSVRLVKRIDAHLNHIPWNECFSEYHTPLHRAIRKYGVDKFEVSILELCNRDALDEREIYWIKHYNTFIADGGNGYNQTIGGNNCAKTSNYLYPHLDKITDLLANSNYTQWQIAEMFNTTPGMIQQINTGKCWYRETLEYPIRKFHLHKTSAKSGYVELVQYPLKDKQNQECKMCGITIKYPRLYCDACLSAYKHMSKRSCPDDFIDIASNTKSKSYLCKYYRAGYNQINRWLLECNIKLKDSNKVVKSTKQKHAQKVAKYLNLDDLEPIYIYNSIYAASRSTGVRAPSMIIKACTNNVQYKGYYWQYID